MNRHDFDSLEIEANAAPHICSSHLSFRDSNTPKLLRRIEKAALDQLEPGQNFGRVYPLPDDDIGNIS